jgi:hypothetical protein
MEYVAMTARRWIQSDARMRWSVKQAYVEAGQLPQPPCLCTGTTGQGAGFDLD